MRCAIALGIALALPSVLRAQESERAPARPAPLQQSLGTYLESNWEPGDQDLLRMPVTWSIGSGSPRVTLLELEPAVGWHFTGGSEDASGLSYTRVRFYHFYGSGRLTVGPDFEAYIKTGRTRSWDSATTADAGVQAASCCPRLARSARALWSPKTKPGA